MLLITQQIPVIVMYRDRMVDSDIAKTHYSKTAKENTLGYGLTKVERGQSRVHPPRRTMALRRSARKAKGRFCPR